MNRGRSLTPAIGYEQLPGMDLRSQLLFESDKCVILGGNEACHFPLFIFNEGKL